MSSLSWVSLKKYAFESWDRTFNYQIKSYIKA